MPSAAQAATIYDDFHSNYRKLESWHMRRRGSVLQSKYAESSSVLFSVLRPAKPPVLETLVRHQAYEILAVDVVSNQLQLDGIPSGRGTSCFSVEGQTIHLTKVEGALCSVPTEEISLVQDGASIEQEQFLTEPSHVFEEFIDLWQPRWNQHVGIRPDHWDRILNFTGFLPPTASFVFPL